MSNRYSILPDANKSLQVTVKKLWMGHVSVRDYVVKKAIDTGKSITVHFHSFERTYSPEELKNFLGNSAGEEFTSKFDGKTYKLIDLPFL